jgi:hypothetical protein
MNPYNSYYDTETIKKKYEYKTNQYMTNMNESSYFEGLIKVSIYYLSLVFRSR